jgi:predicted transcriptional regulator of viral defense system
MRYDEFASKVRFYPVFGEDVLSTLGSTKAARRLQLNRWNRAGKVIRLKRGLYGLPEERRGAPLSVRWLANALYSPSYLSLEYMLSWYDMIPERVSDVTSITTLKTASFKNALGHFVYRNLKKDLFFGFEEVKDEFGSTVLVATPEKAILDYIYLYSGWKSDRSFLEKNIRLQQLDQLDKKRLKEFVKKFSSKKVEQAVKLLLEVAS